MSARAASKKRKRQRTAQNKHAGPRITLTGLPLEILGDILLYTCSPATVVAVSRTCSFLYNSLVRSTSASFIWRGVRETCKPIPLLDPGSAFNDSEADFAAFVFGGGVCEVCRKTTRAMYVSFGARIRLCGSWPCRRKFLSESLIDVADVSPDPDLQRFGAPHVESNLCFYPSTSVVSSWPRYDKILMRKTDVAKYEPDIAAYTSIFEPPRSYPLDSNGLSGFQLEEHQQQMRGNKRMFRFCAIMHFSVRLLRWKLAYDHEYKNIKKQNRTWTKNLAEIEGWNLENLLASQTYSSLQSRKNFLLENIESDDVMPIRSKIEAELVTMQVHHKRQKAEATYREKLAEVKKIYERMRCGTMGATGPSDPTSDLILPTLNVFCSLPFVRTLKGSPDPSKMPANGSSSASDIESTPLTMSLIMSDIHTWLIPVQKYLMNLLGYADGWESASTRTLHPLKRVTARFLCKRCGEGKVGKKYRREQCLDLQGVCSHVCTAVQGKKNEEQRQAAPEEEVSDSDDGGQDKHRGKCKKKGRAKTLDWKVDVFEKDEKAICLIKTILLLTGLSEEDPSTLSALNEMGGTIRCLSCAGWIVMDFATAIGHAHRHESMRIQLLSRSSPSDNMSMRRDANAARGRMDNMIDISRLAFQRGVTEMLLGPTYRAHKLCERVDFGCRHCLCMSESNILIVIENAAAKGVRRMSFNALRSHVKAKHGIKDIGDEDIFYYSYFGIGGGKF